MSLPILRKRIASQPVVSAASGTLNTPLPALPQPSGRESATGGFARIMRGLFGAAQPVQSSASFQVVTPGKGSFYKYHQGDLFTPGTENYVFDYPNELPLLTIWGRSFLRKPNTFLPYQPPQSYSQANVVISGIGGLQAGQFISQGLEE